MRRREKTVGEAGEVADEVIEGRRGGAGFFDLEDQADEMARQATLRSLVEPRVR
jgi:NTP pyrophosphatase (non-canonical NTP hydrolase)